jgi:hypothetical protein
VVHPRSATVLVHDNARYPSPDSRPPEIALPFADNQFSQGIRNAPQQDLFVANSGERVRPFP